VDIVPEGVKPKGYGRLFMNKESFLRSRSGLTFLVLLVTMALGIAIGTIVSDGVFSAEQSKAAQLRISADAEPLVAGEVLTLQESFRKVADVIEPAVVNISTRTVVEVSRRSPHPEQFREFFGDDLWERFFGGPEGGPSRQSRSSLGSGVIVDPSGYILSNHHVVAPVSSRSGRRIADKIEVQLQSGETYRAEVVGIDPESDLAVLKINAGKPLPAAKIGDSSKLRVGDWVMAVGSPFGFSQTVTAGIVSATKRVVPDTQSFTDYIQTDAAINPGNSGGPLVNMRGEVIGINTFITTNTGQFAGIGFAIPSSVFVDSYNQLISGGKIQRGWLGVSMNTFPMTPELAKFFGVAGDDPEGIKDGDGVIVTQLIDEKGDPSTTGPAARAGIKEEDVIVKFGDREIEDLWGLRTAVASTPPGKKVPVVVVRKGEVIRTEVELAERTLEERQRSEAQGFSFEEEEPPPKPKEIGLEFQTLSSRDASQLRIEGETGVLILSVTPGSLAEDAGLVPRVVVTHVNGKRVTTASEFKDAVTSVPSGEGVVLRIVIPPGQANQKSVAYTAFVKP
jgi:serine protease Do